jgi:hypothetical protein
MVDFRHLATQTQGFSAGMAPAFRAGMRWTVLVCAAMIAAPASALEPRLDLVAIEDQDARAQVMEATGYAMMALGTAGILAAIPLGVWSPPFLDNNERPSTAAAMTSIGLGVAGNLLLLVGIPLLVKGARGKREARRMRTDARGVGIAF